MHTEKHTRLVKRVFLNSQFHFLHFCDLHGKHRASSYNQGHISILSRQWPCLTYGQIQCHSLQSVLHTPFTIKG